ncbi:4-phosphoerythronate dehydrogenase [Marinicella gelatinilytica]|uniref:4-phosphoerythronate dehydrogenase n=1 Tax=Marinicella gelatinilytica TaxID=2996017 RepID=UPI002260AE35|nr:4-phosphoerythronate dehydrogenase [Marinicella gelatinilytica]MCX7545474.1 4-phosphoerythronate dehydrogenase [Marinicella gelatinilytica]
MTQPLRVVADENIPGLDEALPHDVNILYLPGREIQHRHVQQADILLVRSITQVNADLLKGTSVKFVGTATIGLDHIDRDYLHHAGIDFAYAPGSNAQSVVEYVLAAMAYWLQQDKKSFQDLTVGIVGVGRIGGLLQTYLQQMGVRCLLCDPPRQAQQPELNFYPLQDMVEADVISFHVPLTDTGLWPTKHMITQSFLSSLKTDQLLVNSARGAVLDNEMALAHVKNNSASPALVLDVWENEPRINVDLMQHCLLATPHIAGYAIEGKWRATQMLCQALAKRFNVSVNSTHLDKRIQVSDSWVPHPNDDLLARLQYYYPIVRDDTALRSVVDELPDSFDKLRKSYPTRHEFLAPLPSSG